MQISPNGHCDDHLPKTYISSCFINFMENKSGNKNYKNNLFEDSCADLLELFNRKKKKFRRP